MEYIIQEKMFKYKLLVEYKGTGFVGWQRQKTGVSVQEEIEKAMLKFSGCEATLFAAGRTDAGVHAVGQVCHFEIEKEYSVDEVQGALNYHLKPNAISILSVEMTDESFHARFSAKYRSYVYKIVTRRAPLAIMDGLAWHITENLDISKMQEAAKVLIGTHDLTSFRSSHCAAKNPVRTIDVIEVRRKSLEELEIYIKAPSFLHNQVRIIVGCLYKVGIGALSKDGLKEILEAKDRTKAMQTAPAEGLYLYEVGY